MKMRGILLDALECVANEVLLLLMETITTNGNRIRFNLSKRKKDFGIYSTCIFSRLKSFAIISARVSLVIVYSLHIVAIVLCRLIGFINKTCDNATMENEKSQDHVTSFPDTIGNAWHCIYARIYTDTRVHRRNRELINKSRTLAPCLHMDESSVRVTPQHG